MISKPSPMPESIGQSGLENFSKHGRRRRLSLHDTARCASCWSSEAFFCSCRSNVLDAVFDALQPRRCTPLEAWRVLAGDIVGISGNLNRDRGKLDGQKVTNPADSAYRQQRHQGRADETSDKRFQTTGNRAEGHRQNRGHRQRQQYILAKIENDRRNNQSENSR